MNGSVYLDQNRSRVSGLSFTHRLDRFLDNIPNDPDLMFLPKTQSARNSLALNMRVPLRLDQEDAIRRRQIQPTYLSSAP